MVSGLTDVLFWCTSGLSLRAEVAFSTLTSGLSEGRSGTVESWWTWPTSLRGKSTLGICMRTTFTLHQNQLMPSIGIPPAGMCLFLLIGSVTQIPEGSDSLSIPYLIKWTCGIQDTRPSYLNEHGLMNFSPPPTHSTTRLFYITFNGVFIAHQQTWTWLCHSSTSQL